MKKTLLIILCLCLTLISTHCFYIRSMRATEHYPTDTFLTHVANKRALIITAHDDDAFSCSGTFIGLIRNGWSVRQVAFLDRRPEKAVYFDALAKSAGLSGYNLIDLQYRTDLDTEKTPYMPMPYNRIDKVFRHDTVLSVVGRIIDSFRPEVIFTLDDSIGGYGHPDHIFMSRVVLEYCRKKAASPDFSVRRIYQSVYPPSMSHSIIVKNSWTSKNPYIEACKLYGIKGMPEPNVEICITPYASEKKRYISGYGPADQKNILKFAPAYKWYPALLYFRIFDREFFRVIDLKLK